MQTGINDKRHALLIHAPIAITRRLYLVHMLKIVEIAYRRSWKSMNRRWRRKVRKFGLH